MNKSTTIILAGLATTLLVMATPLVRSTSAAIPAPAAASAKATCAVSDVHLMSATEAAGWTTILSNSIKTSNKSDMFCDVSLESGILTRTAVASKGGKKSTSTADAEIRVRCLINGEMAYPGEVVFASRYQELSATFQGIIEECFSVDEEGNVVLDEECVEPEEVEMVLSTMAANSFNFIYGDCDPGTHTVEIQATVQTSAYSDSEDGVANAYALIGKGSTTVEQVRMTNDEIVF